MQQQSNISQTSAPEQQNPVYSGPPGKKSREGISSILSTVLILIAAPLIALFLTAFVFQSYEVDGPSMETTLQNHDRLIVVKAGKTWSRITGNDYIPKRGEIVVFSKPGLSAFGESDNKQLIKRVIGLPGERVVVRDGIITIYNDQFPDGFRPDKTGEYSVIEPTPGNIDISVPAGEVFVSGDNRSNSLDSRNFGTIPSRDIVGKLSLRIFPLNKLDSY